MLSNTAETLRARPQLYRAKLGVYLLIVSLSIFFVAALIAYALIRTSVGIQLEPLVMPLSFWVSTLALLATSFFLHLAVLSIRREKQIRYRRFLWAAMVFGGFFLVLQAEGMWSLIRTHFALEAGYGKLYGICFSIALLHAAHVIGGGFFLGYVWAETRKGKYDHERHWTVDICATYWHFLDVVWILMLITFWWTESSLRS
ncbi:MAG: cytochrome c oxidase subunit 3 [Planctomycetota bacterium]|nr:cytochrome c oxidase subunit 3 [Planctomycetota bacterium]